MTISRIIHRSTRGRVTEIRLGNKTFTTPTRAINHSELSYYRSLFKYQTSRRLSDTDVPPCEIQEIIMDFSDESLMFLKEKNGYFKNRRSFIRTNNKNGNNRVSLCIPQFKKQGEPISKESIDMLTLLQVDAGGLDFVSVPDPHKNSIYPTALEKAIKAARETLDGVGQDHSRILPVLDLETNPTPLKRRISFLLDSGFEAIAFRHRPNIPSAYAVSEILADEDVWIHLSGVQRKRGNRILDVSQLHVMPFFSFDTICSYKNPSGARTKKMQEDDPFPKIGGGPDPGKQPDSMKRLLTEIEQRKARGVQKVTRFDSAALGFLNWKGHLDLLGHALNCDCFLCKDKTVDTFFQEYGEHDGKFSRTKFRIHNRIHELFASHSEFQVAQKEILTDAFVDYLRAKPLFQRIDTGIGEIDYGQTTLV